MFFESVFVSLKLFFLKKKVNKKSLSILLRPSQDLPLKPLALLIDLDVYDLEAVLHQCSIIFEVPEVDIEVLGFSVKGVACKVPNFKIRKELSWFNGVENMHVALFISKPYKYFIDFHESNAPSVCLIALKTKANFRIGFKGHNYKTADFILETPLSNQTTLFNALALYIKKITI
jgi:hypothetical protein